MFTRTLFILFLITTVSSVHIINLNGDWLVHDDTNNITDIKAKVPGGIYSDLMNNGIIGDILYGYNDVDTKWVSRLNWIYTNNFLVEREFLIQENINIVFEGLDTFSSIYINNELIGKSENMFVQYIFDVKKYIKLGVNTIEIRFLSPVEVAANLHALQNYTITPTCPPTEYNGECHVNMLRKMQAAFSWDWGPSFPSVGIWKNTYIESYNHTVIRYITSDITEENEDNWNVNLDIYLSNKAVGRIELHLGLNSFNLTASINVNAEPNEFGETVVSTKLTILKTNVNVWWPNGYGTSDLYNLRATYKNKEENDVSTKVIRIGFRTIELVQDELDSGLTFYFKVNNIPIFMKGSNEIPIDILPERGQNKTTIKKILTTVKDSHMNMIRVWGGGLYESDYFYDLADEYGILIWQDFMFACAMYPTNNFQSVISEVRHQVKRLYHHPSIALFSGNNENEAALRQNWYNTESNFNTYYNDYIKLYITTIKPEYTRLTHNRGLFITSSPTNGKESDKEDYVAKNPSDSLYGDVHFYNYVADPFDSNIYPVPRFASEYGYQSLPSTSSILSATNNTNDLNIDSDFMNHRQHHPEGNIQMKTMMEMYFKLPSNKAFIYYSQIAQALAIKIETEHYRRYRSILNDKGEGLTMGALYWQLNDLWIGPTWSGMDCFGKWKILQYYAKDFFAPVIITGHINNQRGLDIYLVSDLLTPVFNLKISIHVYKWDSFKAVVKETFSIDTEMSSSKLVNSIKVDEYLSKNGCGSLQTAKNNCFFHLSVNKGDVRVTPDNFVFPSAIKNSNIIQGDVKVKSVKKISDENVFQLEVITDKISLFVWLDSAKVDGKFSENGFMLTEPMRYVYFYAEENCEEDDLLKTITVTHLLDKELF